MNLKIQFLLLEMLESYTKLIRSDEPDQKILINALVVNYAAKIEALIMRGGKHA